MKDIVRKVKIVGVTPIMFDKYAGDNKTQLLPEQKMYLNSDMELQIPCANIHSFLCAQNTKSACKMFYDPRKYKQVAAAILGFVMIQPLDGLSSSIGLLRDGKPIKWEGWGKNGITLHKSVARLDKGIPNPKERPLIDTPWEASFRLTLWENSDVSEMEVKNLFIKGGLAIGLGTYRGVFGKFAIQDWA